MEIEFTSQKELYQRLLPALRTKVNEMHRNGYTYIRVEDIWNYLVETKWKKAHDLALYNLVSDILHSDECYIDNYIKRKLMEQRLKLKASVLF